MKPNWPLLSLLRFALAVVVFSSHTPNAGAQGLDGLRWFGPFAAVVVFFMLSGFVMQRTITQRPRGFFGRRAARIMPEFVASMLLAGAAMAIGGGVVKWNGPTVEMDSALFALHLLPIQATLLPSPSWNAPAWSLGIEAAFYLLCPLLVRVPRSWRWAALLASSAVYCTMAPRVAFASGDGVLAVAGLWWAFLLGWQLAEAQSEGARYMAVLWPLLMFSVFSYYGGNGAMFCAAACALLIVNQDKVKIPDQLTGVANWCGDFSYTLYIVHWPALLLTVALGIKNPLAIVCAAVAVCVGVHQTISAARRVVRVNKLATSAA